MREPQPVFGQRQGEVLVPCLVRRPPAAPLVEASRAGLSRVLFLSVVRWPGALREQRAATAVAYRALSALAAGSSATSRLPSGAALDDAQSMLSSLTMFGTQR